ncbi:HhH-GPD domain containing protein, partial [Asbolus verrucosus]
MKRITKDKSIKTDRVTRRNRTVSAPEAEPDEETKFDLSKFKLTPKPKLSLKTEADIKQEPRPEPLDSINVKEVKTIKREHIKIEPDCDGASSAKNVKIDGAPANWEQVLHNLREMRKNCDAPVDSMGCDKCQDGTASPETIRYQALLALMLSSQTKDQVTYAAMMRLQSHGCTVDNISATSDEKLGELIYPVGFWKSKVKYIKKTTDILKRDYGGDIPKTAGDLCK